MKPIQIKVNDKNYNVLVEPHENLAKVLRDKCGLTGTKIGCEQGACGACTILLDGKAVNACLVLALQAQSKEIETIEGMGTPDRLHPLQESFIKNGAVQCGFCTPGMLMSARAMLRENPSPNLQEIKRGISGNLCRCTGYTKIVKAIQGVSQTGSSGMQAVLRGVFTSPNRPRGSHHDR